LEAIPRVEAIPRLEAIPIVPPVIPIPPPPRPRVVLPILKPRPRPIKPKKLRKKLRRLTAYNPSLTAVWYGIVGKPKRPLTGIFARPIPPQRLRKMKI